MGSIGEQLRSRWFGRVEWFEEKKGRIRGYSGVRYYDACVEITKIWPLKDQQRSISYTLPSVPLSRLSYYPQPIGLYSHCNPNGPIAD